MGLRFELSGAIFRPLWKRFRFIPDIDKSKDCLCISWL